MWSLLISVAAAGPIFLSVGPEIALSEDGNWPRLFPADGGRWHFLHANSGEYNYVQLDSHFQRIEGTQRPLTGETRLRDHGIARCPDGTYLDAATAELDRPNDSLYVFRFDEDFNLLGRATVFERADATTPLADVPAVCGESFRGVAWLEPWNSVGTQYAALDGALRVTGVHGLWDAPQAMGSSLLEEDGELRVIGFPAVGETPNLIFASYDTDFQPVHHWEAEVVPEGWTPYWAQGSLRVGDVYIVAHMAQDDDYEWATLGGDLWVQALDLDWNLLDQVKITSNVAPDGGMQPGMARVGNEVVLTYSKDLHNYVYEVTIDLVACGELDGGDDTGGDAGDTAPPADTAADTGTPGEHTGGDTTGDSAPDDGGDPADPGDAPPPACGCSTPARSGVWPAEPGFPRRGGAAGGLANPSASGAPDADRSAGDPSAPPRVGNPGPSSPTAGLLVLLAVGVLRRRGAPSNPPGAP